MNAPWANKTGLAKLIAIFSTVLVLTLGLCGVNLVTAITSAHSGGKTANALFQLASFAALPELFVIAVCILALLVLLIMKVFERPDQ